MCALLRTEKTFSEVATSCKSFLQGMNMLIAEYDYDVDIAVQREEEREIALKEGLYQKALETARILKQLGDSAQKIMQVTGLTEAEIKQL